MESFSSKDPPTEYDLEKNHHNTKPMGNNIYDFTTLMRTDFFLHCYCLPREKILAFKPASDFQMKTEERTVLKYGKMLGG